MSWWGGNINGKTRAQVHVLVAENRKRMRQQFFACLFFTCAQWQPIRQTRSDNNYKIYFLPHKLGGFGVFCARQVGEEVYFVLRECWMNIFVLGFGGKLLKLEYCCAWGRRQSVWGIFLCLGVQGGVLVPTPQRRKLWSLHHGGAMPMLCQAPVPCIHTFCS